MQYVPIDLRLFIFPGARSDRYSEIVPLRSLSDTESAYPRMEMSGELDLDLVDRCQCYV
jgi:hypothetical protein